MKYKIEELSKGSLYTLASILSTRTFEFNIDHGFLPDDFVAVESREQLVPRRSILKTDEASSNIFGAKPQDRKDFKTQSSNKIVETVAKPAKQTNSSVSQCLDNYDDIKYNAVEQIWYKLISELSMLENEHHCRNEHFASMEMPHNIFSWNMDDWLARRSLGLVWLNLLQKQLTSECLETRKMKMEYTELKRFINLILQNYVKTKRNFHMVSHELHKAMDYFHLLETLTNEFENNTQTLQTNIHEIIKLNFVSRISKVTFPAEDTDATEGTEEFEQQTLVRFVKQYYKSAEEFIQYCSGTKEEHDELAIKKTITHCDNELYCSQSTMNYYYNEHQSLRFRVGKLVEKYDRDYDKVMSINTYTRLSMKNLTTRKQYLKEQIQRYHDEIQEIKAAQIAEKQAEVERQRLEAEAEVQRLHEIKLAERKKNKKNIKKI